MSASQDAPRIDEANNTLRIKTALPGHRSVSVDLGSSVRSGGPGGKLDQVAGEDPRPVQFRAPSRWSRRLRSQPVSDLPLPAEPVSTVVTAKLRRAATPANPTIMLFASAPRRRPGPQAGDSHGEVLNVYMELHEEAATGRRSERIR